MLLFYELPEVKEVHQAHHLSLPAHGLHSVFLSSEGRHSEKEPSEALGKPQQETGRDSWEETSSQTG